MSAPLLRAVGEARVDDTDHSHDSKSPDDTSVWWTFEVDVVAVFTNDGHMAVYDTRADGGTSISPLAI